MFSFTSAMPWRRTRRALAIVAALLLLLGAGLYIRHWNEQAMYRDYIRSHVSGIERSDGRFVEAVNDLVYHRGGFAKNRSYLVRPGDGPLPADVFEHGGDCADKSTLLSAMLRSVGVEATLVMLQPCRDCKPTHTVVEARYDGGWMVADPVYNLVVPTGNGRYASVSDIASDRQALEQRLAELREKRGPGDKINYYSQDDQQYGFPKTINWDARLPLHWVGEQLRRFTDNPFMIRRPYFLEDPLLRWALLCALGGGGLLGVSWLLGRRRR